LNGEKVPTLNASNNHQNKKSTDFGFAVNLRQTEVKSEYRKNADKPDAEYHQPGDATTFKSILNEYGKDGEVLGLVVGYSDEALSDVHRVADLVATRLASKQLEYLRTLKSIAKAMQTQRICRAWGHSCARGFARVILDRMRGNLNPAPGSRNWGSELGADAEFNFNYPFFLTPPFPRGWTVSRIHFFRPSSKAPKKDLDFSFT
jgi:hypothetical protein